MLSKIHQERLRGKKPEKKKAYKSGLRFYSEKEKKLFRSTWEVELAELLTELGITYEYEKERFYFRAERESYLPDYYLPEYNVWIECKGYMDERSLRRIKLFRKYYGAASGFFLYEKEERELILNNPQLIWTYLELAEEERLRRETNG